LLSVFGFTVVGTDENYFLKTSGDRPFGIAFDNSGSMYMVTAPPQGNGTLSKVTPDGKITNIAALEGNFIGPGIFIDKAGNILITVGDKLLRRSTNGQVKIIADGFLRCFDVKADNHENIYVSDALANTIYKISPSGIKTVFYQCGSTGPFVLTGLTFDPNNDNLYAKEGNKLIKFHLTPNGIPAKPVTVIDNTKIFYLCTDNHGNIYASTIDNVIKIDTGAKVQPLSPQPLKTSIGLTIGGKGFDENALYIAVADGIIKLPVQK